jgi:hypothetical protein
MLSEKKLLKLKPKFFPKIKSLGLAHKWKDALLNNPGISDKIKQQLRSEEYSEKYEDYAFASLIDKLMKFADIYFKYSNNKIY